MSAYRLVKRFFVAVAVELLITALLCLAVVAAQNTHHLISGDTPDTEYGIFGDYISFDFLNHIW